MELESRILEDVPDEPATSPETRRMFLHRGSDCYVRCSRHSVEDPLWIEVRPKRGYHCCYGRDCSCGSGHRKEGEELGRCDYIFTHADEEAFDASKAEGSTEITPETTPKDTVKKEEEEEEGEDKFECCRCQELSEELGYACTEHDKKVCQGCFDDGMMCKDSPNCAACECDLSCSESDNDYCEEHDTQTCADCSCPGSHCQHCGRDCGC